MGETTGIEWTDKTFNGVIGCAKVSPGCEHCYAETDQDKRRGRVKWGVNGTRSITTDSNWKQPVAWNAEAKKFGIRYKVFAYSLADVFELWLGQVRNHKQEPLEIKTPDEHGHGGSKWVPMTLDHIRARLFKLIEETPYLDWQLLTKRIENVMSMVPDNWKLQFPANVWIGATIEDQKRFDDRIRHLSEIPAVVRFISYEPALGPIKSYPFLGDDSQKQVAGKPDPRLRGIQWVICGGESGPEARLMSPEWARNMRDQCALSNVPFFFKQWGTIHHLDFVTEDELFEYTNAGWDGSKKKGGSNLDGKEHKNFPEMPQRVTLGDDQYFIYPNFGTRFPREKTTE